MATEPFGALDGRPVQALTISNGAVSARLITYGARLVELWTPDRNGALADIVLGFDDLASYVATDTYFGATCGRYGNRITDGRFSLDGETTLQVDANEGRNHLHGGKQGYDRKIWDITEQTADSVTFTAISEDGEMGFPGRCRLTARYALTPDNRLIVTMEADTDRLTVMNMVHHSYFNLAGQGAGDVLGQTIRIAADFFTPIDEHLMPTGEILSVAGTPYDFRAAHAIGRDIAALSGIGGEVFAEGGGYDHNWCLRQAGTGLRLAAEAADPASGRTLTLHTTEPGLQFYTGGYLNERITGKRGAALCKYAGFTLETQKFPDAPNFAHFPDCLLRPGETYRQDMVFAFGTSPA